MNAKCAKLKVNKSHKFCFKDSETLNQLHVNKAA